MVESAEAIAGRMRRDFLERHHDAHELVFDARTHQAIGAVYYAPDWWDTPEKKRQSLRDFFSLVAAADLEVLEGSD